MKCNRPVSGGTEEHYFLTMEDVQTGRQLARFAQGYGLASTLVHAGTVYVLLYLEHRTPRWFFETYLARSKDLAHSELSAANPILTPGSNDGINASDPDLTEFRGQTYLYYSVGDQRTWSKLRRAVYPGRSREFFVRFFVEPGLPEAAKIPGRR